MKRRLKTVLIEWQDSNIIHGWRLEEQNDNALAHCRTVGILIEETEKMVTVALSDSDCGSVMETITIPKGCITRIRELRVK